MLPKKQHRCQLLRIAVAEKKLSSLPSGLPLNHLPSIGMTRTQGKPYCHLTHQIAVTSPSQPPDHCNRHDHHQPHRRTSQPPPDEQRKNGVITPIIDGGCQNPSTRSKRTDHDIRSAGKATTSSTTNIGSTPPSPAQQREEEATATPSPPQSSDRRNHPTANTSCQHQTPPHAPSTTTCTTIIQTHIGKDQRCPRPS